jgi:hypothetical protein
MVGGAGGLEPPTRRLKVDNPHAAARIVLSVSVGQHSSLSAKMRTSLRGGSDAAPVSFTSIAMSEKV